jgi:hypothetical protein
MYMKKHENSDLGLKKYKKVRKKVSVNRLYYDIQIREKICSSILVFIIIGIYYLLNVKGDRVQVRTIINMYSFGTLANSLGRPLFRIFYRWVGWIPYW